MQDIYTPGSYDEFQLDHKDLIRESPDMVSRFARDLRVVIGEAINPMY
jgi:hypothetical protein